MTDLQEREQGSVGKREVRRGDNQGTCPTETD